ncbi:mannitol dehydrogenase family protein [Caulobacter sp. NIBR2454]|uniref:mannitol dehydrogenase family protein n=1 Tax=Caulobacter sp. NIBR2454 TaxID=3015996 RepID=UPI0022B6BF67|nr:mannitol dehydrogenase family protein [Caulobacter sp. NIBR2454]
MTKLSLSTLASASAKVLKPAYDPASVEIGIVHFGPGAFHRAHQAFYFDALLATDSRWGICAVSLKSPGVRDALGPQDGLYVLAQLDAETTFRVIGSIRETLVAPENPEAVFARLAAPATRVVSLTVTEKGYCLGGDGKLDLANTDIAHDLTDPRRPDSVIGYIVEGLRRRREAGLAPFTVISCDNLADNGHKLRDAVVAFAGKLDTGLADWIAAQTAFPRTMVDSITPATDDALRARVTAETGFDDAWPIQREAFVQWVVEDTLPKDGPDLASVGVTLTNDVAAFEGAKLRLLNGAHSTLAYVGLSRGYETVGDAMADAQLAGFVRDMMLEDIAPSLSTPPGLDIPTYVEAILGRFRNPEIRHLLAQIAWDGSKKLPFRILETAAEAVAADRPLNRLAVPIAAWIAFIAARAKAGTPPVDPLADKLMGLGAACTGGPEDVDAFLKLEAVFPPSLASDAGFSTAVKAAYATLVQA